ncbi:hypothetical protein CHGG_09095 [Chaetomium globosum CBS 148.51]|uniref:Transcriptional regulatory protein RXT2 N-terminal domain-containing protein n=1 Tax=Chaetomium globosum (strain ATCC 6205 / CBS 148.51 / DSM 1962 / NBRC 6347 / NRRL 1970) TaxID=306901 RepID=Q2GSF9_CHAGB|nr:uncharacterized protein CHGG_09095 [Chaetomium globosum CBS 148.51]EAQ85081.1 hypothetical protein CHGG_09095 [Chaetomium globosum CBS 148.51]
MSTQQQAMIMDTLLTLRRTRKRKAHDSDSDSSIDETTNRGNKLKKRARFVHEGRLASSMGPAAYKEVGVGATRIVMMGCGLGLTRLQIAEHAGYQRAIINLNPPLIDEDGYDIDSDDDEEQVQEAIASALEENPYSSVRLELGDNTWAPCGLMTAPDNRDAVLFSDTASFFNRPVGRAPTRSQHPAQTASFKSIFTESAVRGTAQGATQSRTHAGQDREPGEKANGRESPADAQSDNYGKDGSGKGPATTKSLEKGGQAGGIADHEGQNDGVLVNGDTSSAKPGATEGRDVEMVEPSAADQERPNRNGVPPPPDMLAAFPLPEITGELFIHPLFQLPPAARPDRNLGLPDQEAEEVRRLLLLYVQKQEEICRGTKRLYEGLLKADRLRQTVWHWSKAEAHSGPNRDMSDGEDWYDKEAWGLTEDLKKGEDEVEEDTAQTQKKTRNRK